MYSAVLTNQNGSETIKPILLKKPEPIVLIICNVESMRYGSFWPGKTRGTR
jgi:hypothetical protein